MSAIVPLRFGGRHMRFVLVNGRTPCPQTFCVLCCEPIGASYLREIGTRLCYCHHGSRKSRESIMSSTRHSERQSDRPRRPPLRSAERSTDPAVEEKGLRGR